MSLIGRVLLRLSRVSHRHATAVRLVLFVVVFVVCYNLMHNPPAQSTNNKGSRSEDNVLEGKTNLVNEGNNKKHGLKWHDMDEKEVAVAAREMHRADRYNKESDSNDGTKKDWHDYEKIQADKLRVGNGEHGMAYRMPTDTLAGKSQQATYRTNGFNAAASDDIALNRSVKDIRHRDCRSKKYLADLPTVSVILPFFNEHWTTLLRSVYSIINNSPKELLKEVILADDASTKEFLGKDLDDYVAKHWPGIVKVVRARERDGLIKARLNGAKVATGDVLLFLDSHSECNYNWLPPLLEPIKKDRKTAVCPFVDVIDFDTFEYRAQDEGARGAFDWELYYKRLPLLPESEKNPTEPFDNPVMAGGYFAIDASWFWELGGYDDGLLIWGGEQYELSFKIWQCGGRLVDVPCSRVGHIYRKFSPFPSSGKGDYLSRNYRRVAEVWMDEYAEYIYKRRPHYRNVDPGDISVQKALREKLHCKSFKWFMTEVAFDLPRKYPPFEPDPGAEGEIRNMAASGYCVDARFKGANQPVELRRCVKDDPSEGGDQTFELTFRSDIRPKRRNNCFDIPHSEDRAPVLLFPCHGGGGNQMWTYSPSSKQIMHPPSGSCLDCDVDNHQLFVSKCRSGVLSQQWTWGTIRKELLDKMERGEVGLL